LELASKNEEISQWFYLTDGTALSEFYLKHRLSEDLDFFSRSDVNDTKIDAFIRNTLAQLGGIRFAKRKYMGLFIYELYFSESEILKLDFNNFDFPFVERSKTRFQNIVIDSLYDIAVNKLYIFTGKPRSRDYVDLYFILQTEEFSLEQILHRMEEKFSMTVDPFFVTSQFLRVKDITDLPTMLIPFDKKEMEDFYLKLAKSLEGEIFV
jgi:hypothetical protein